MRHGSKIDPANRFEAVRQETDLEHLEWDNEYRQELANRRIEYLPDASQSIVTKNNSPDIPFNYSINPYKGCVHGCSYCYARNTHEYLGFNAGLDFETKILVKHEAPQLFRKFLSRKSWQPEPITFSGATDCYQPAERQFRLTRQCLEVAWEFRQPISMITKNALVLRDLDLLQAMAAENLVHVFVSITSLDPELARVMEPRTSTPEARLRAVSMLSEAGVPVGVMTAPIIPGLNDSEIPALLAAVKEAGARRANYTLLRLPLTVEPVFLEWLERTHPQQQSKVEAYLRDMRDGKLSDSTWGKRMRGSGEMAAQIKSMFGVFAAKHGLNKPLPPQDCSKFEVPQEGPKQLPLF